MSDTTGGSGSSIDPSLRKLIEEIVEKKIADRLEAVQTTVGQVQSRPESAETEEVADRVSLLVFSCDMDKLLCAFIIAAGAAAMGMEVSMYFAFWGLVAVKKKTIFSKKPFLKKMLAAMLPSGPRRVGTSKMNMLGIGPAFFKMLMKKENVESLPALIDQVRELGVKLVACTMSMGVMGMKEEELLDDVEYGNVATYLEEASKSKVTLFI
ncbi:MAG TPA: DsrE/DsrF/DrsH-like family protein [Thermoguttaceae bacterium]|nr:DsrE/DsrF/DrsH-like family protein [Thermoguttaceae bacterium]